MNLPLRKWILISIQSLFVSALLCSAQGEAELTPPDYELLADNSGLKIHTPILEKRQFAKLRLKNGMSVYLISDPGIEQSAAALAVKAGSWQDPENYPGMAHFLEHMLFMGTKAYPEESEYMRYISDNGGMVNAFTANDRTVYMFSVNNQAFDGALDRFSHFFIDPLFSPSSINRELHAVDQEHSKNLEHDGWRQYMIFKESGNQDHPNCKFCTGNAKTLKGIPQNEMISWYKRFYSADRMHLIVLSALPLEKMIELATRDFSPVAVSNQPLAPIESPLASDIQRTHLTYIKPVKDIKILNLSWELSKESAEDNRVKTGDLLAHILKSSAPGTLKEQLKRSHLIVDLTATQESFSQQHKLFTIELELTDEGLKQIDHIAALCFSYLSHIQQNGIPRSTYEEVRTMATLHYQYQSRQDAFEFVKEQANALPDEELETFPLKTMMPTRFDPHFNQRYLKQLTPEACLVTLLADPSKTGVAPANKEKWMGAEYTLLAKSDETLASWKKANHSSSLSLPPPNPFIPDSLVERGPGNSTPSLEKIYPSSLADTPNGRLYYAKDPYYLVPQVAHCFRLRSPLLDGSARSKALCDLYLRALEEKIAPTLSMASNAGLHIQVSQEQFHLAVTLDGFSPKSSALAKEFFSSLRGIKPSKQEFELYKQTLLATYENSSKELPCVQSFELLGSLLFNCAPLSTEKAQALSALTYEEWVSFCEQLFEKCYLEALLYGELSSDEALALWAELQEKLAAQPYLREEQKQRKVLVLSSEGGPYMLIKKTTMQGNSALLLIEEGPYTFDKRAAQSILAKALKDDFFDTLRTKQQTGYIARSWASEEEGHLLHYFLVQSSTHQPSELIARFELFLENFLKNFSSRISHERFETIRSMTIASLQMRPENPLVMSKRLFTLAFDFEADFDLVEKRIASLEQLSYQQLHETAEHFLSRGNRQRLAILMEGSLPKESNFRYEVTTQDQLRGEGLYLAWK